MKRYAFLTILLLTVLTLLGQSSLASGLPSREDTAMGGVFPDPAQILGQIPELYAHDYAYDTDTFDVYFLQVPEDKEAFLDAWGAALQNSGYAFYRDEVFDGREHVAVFAGDAGVGLLFTDYDGEMMLMVPVSYHYTPDQGGGSAILPGPDDRIDIQSDVPDFQDYVDFKVSVESEGMLAAEGNTYARYGITYATSEKFNSVITGVEAFADVLTSLGFELGGDEHRTYFLQDAYTGYKLARGEGYYKFRYTGTGNVADVVTDLSGSYALTINVQKYMGNEQTFIKLNISPDLVYEGASK